MDAYLIDQAAASQNGPRARRVKLTDPAFRGNLDGGMAKHSRNRGLPINSFGVSSKCSLSTGRENGFELPFLAGSVEDDFHLSIKSATHPVGLRVALVRLDL